MRIVTVTGTSWRVTEAQSASLRRYLVDGGLPRLLRHGMCTGGDEVGHGVAVELGIHVVGHPGVTIEGTTKHRAEFDLSEFLRIWPEQRFLDRNRTMAKCSTDVVALLRSPIWYRSGEWHTATFGKSVGCRVVGIAPDGEQFDI